VSKDKLKERIAILLIENSELRDKNKHLEDCLFDIIDIGFDGMGFAITKIGDCDESEESR
jgi:hypothetical protein